MARIAPAFRAVTSTATATTSITITKPTGVIAGDVLIAQMDYTGASFTPPSGFVLIDEDTVGGGAAKCRISYKICGDSEPANYTWTVDTGASVFGILLAYTGLDQVNPLQLVGTREDLSNTSTPAGASLTTLAPNTMALSVFIDLNATVTWTAPSGFTERIDTSGAEISDQVIAAAGTVVAPTGNGSVASNDIWCCTLLLNPGIAERVYLPASGSPPVSPSFDGSWESSTSADRIKMVLNKSNTSLADTSTRAEPVNSTLNQDYLCRQYVSEILLAPNTTISGFFKGQIQAKESAIGANYRSQVVVYLVDNAGANAKVLYSGDPETLGASGNPTNEFGTTNANRRFPRVATSRALTSQTTHGTGSYLVIEVGVREANSVTTAFTHTMNFGDPTGTGDLPEDDTSTSGVPWFEFSNGLPWWVPEKPIMIQQAVARASYY